MSLSYNLSFNEQLIYAHCAIGLLRSPMRRG